MALFAECWKHPAEPKRCRGAFLGQGGTVASWWALQEAGWGGMVLFLCGALKEGLGVHQAGEGPAECTWTFPPGGHRYKNVWFIPLPHVSVPQGSV